MEYKLEYEVEVVIIALVDGTSSKKTKEYGYWAKFASSFMVYELGSTLH